MKIVLFDFDSTLTKRDTLRPVSHYFARQYHNFVGLAFLYFVLLLPRFRLINDKKLKEAFLNIFLRGKDETSVKAVVGKFLEAHLGSLLNPRVFAALQQYRNNGDKIFIVSANFDFLLEPLVQFWGINGVICTETEKAGGIFTGKIIGNTCKGKDKVAKIKTVFSPQDIANMTAFGDRDDEELLGMVSEVVRIKL